LIQVQNGNPSVGFGMDAWEISRIESTATVYYL